MATELQSRPQPSPHATAADGGIVVEKVSRAYRGTRGEAVPALSDVSLRAARGELVAVVGPSGCGKTTLLELVCRLQSPDSGSIACAPAALMAQSDMLLPWFTFAVLYAAIYARMIRASILETLDEEYVRTARAKGAGETQVLQHHLAGMFVLLLMNMAGLPQDLVAEDRKESRLNTRFMIIVLDKCRAFIHSSHGMRCINGHPVSVWKWALN